MPAETFAARGWVRGCWVFGRIRDIGYVLTVWRGLGQGCIEIAHLIVAQGGGIRGDERVQGVRGQRKAAREGRDGELTCLSRRDALAPGVKHARVLDDRVAGIDKEHPAGEAGIVDGHSEVEVNRLLIRREQGLELEVIFGHGRCERLARWIGIVRRIEDLVGMLSLRNGLAGRAFRDHLDG